MTFESYECGCADGYFDINNNGRVCEACCDEIEFYLHESLNRICKFSHDLNAHFLFKRTISTYVQVWNQIKAQRFKVENSFMIAQKQMSRKIMVKDWNLAVKDSQVNWFHFSTNRVLLKRSNHPKGVLWKDLFNILTFWHIESKIRAMDTGFLEWRSDFSRFGYRNWKWIKREMFSHVYHFCKIRSQMFQTRFKSNTKCSNHHADNY